MSDNKMTEGEFAGKVEWEGGIDDAIDYGLTEDDVEDGALKDAWGEYRQALRSIAPLKRRVQALLEEANGDD